MLDANGKEIVTPDCETNEEGHLATIDIDGKQVKVVNTVTVMEIVVHRLEDGKEVSQFIAHDFMMVEHKTYMVKLLTEAINTVMRTTNKKASLIKAVSTVVAQKLGLMNRKEARSKKW